MKLKVAVKSAKAPVKAPAKVAKRVKAPARTVKAPAKTVKAPAKSVKAPARTVKAPAKSVKAPAKSVKAPRKYRKGGMHDALSVSTLLQTASSGNSRKNLSSLKALPPIMTQPDRIPTLTTTSAISINPLVLRTTALEQVSSLRIDPNTSITELSIKDILDNIYKNTDVEKMDVYSIIMDYKRAYARKDKEDFKIFAKDLLAKLLLINTPYIDNTYANIRAGKNDKNVLEIQSILGELNSVLDIKGGNESFLEKIFNKFIRPHLYNDKGTIKFLADKIKNLKNLSLFIASIEEAKKRISNELIKTADYIANKQIQKKGEDARQAVNRRRGYTGMGREYSMRSTVSSGWNSNATEFGPTTYNVVRADIGVASRNSPVFNTK